MCACNGTLCSPPAAYARHRCLYRIHYVLPEGLILAAHINCEVDPLGDDVHLHSSTRHEDIDTAP